MSEHAPSIGIDFGTSNSSMAWYDPRTGGAEVILNAEGQAKTPSLVHFGEGETVVGQPVADLLEHDVSTEAARREEIFRRTVTSIKRNLIAPPRIALPEGRYVRPVDVSAEVLKKLKRDAEDGHFHEEVGRAVITCPAEFNVLQRRKIEEAGRLAGFSEVVLLEEPVAGALAYARAGLDVGGHVLVYDLGGGTFDLAVLDNEDESFHVAMEPKGMERCGGDDFDLALYHHCDEVSRENLGRPISLSGAVDLSFLRGCRRRKESLTYQEKGKFSGYLSSENGPVRFELEVDRGTFHGLIEEYVETTTRLTEEILEQAEEAGHEVESVVLVGGSTRVLLVAQTLEETLPVRPLAFDKKDVAVALGAAHYTNVLWAPPGNARGSGATIAATPDPESLDLYRKAVEEAILERELDKVGADRLDAFAEQLGLDGERAAEVERRILGDSKEGVLLGRYRGAVETAWADGKLDGLEVEWLGALADELGLGRGKASRAESAVMGAPRETVFGRQALEPEPPGEPEDLVLVSTLTGHSDEVHAVAFGPDERFLASGSSDHAVRGWDARTGEALGALVGHAQRVSSVTIGAGGGLLASGGFDRTVRVWKLPNGEPFHVLNHPDWVFCVAFGIEGKLLASGGADKEIKLWNLENGELLHSLAGHYHWVLSLDISPDGRFLVSGGADKTVRVWDPRSYAQLHAIEHPDWVRSVAVGPEGKLAASGGDDGAVRVWDLETGQAVRAIAGHAGSVFSVAVSPDGRLLHSGGSDGKIKTWSIKTGEPLYVLSGHPKGVGSVAVSPDGQLLASGAHDHVIKIWKKQGAGRASDSDPRRGRFSYSPSRPRANLPTRGPDVPSDLPD